MYLIVLVGCTAPLFVSARNVAPALTYRLFTFRGLPVMRMVCPVGITTLSAATGWAVAVAHVEPPSVDRSQLLTNSQLADALERIMGVCPNATVATTARRRTAWVNRTNVFMRTSE
jgi:xanthine/uracil permease